MLTWGKAGPKWWQKCGPPIRKGRPCACALKAWECFQCHHHADLRLVRHRRPFTFSQMITNVIISKEIMPTERVILKINVVEWLWMHLIICVLTPYETNHLYLWHGIVHARNNSAYSFQAYAQHVRETCNSKWWTYLSEFEYY